MPKVYISPLGIGYGHASRCVNLASKLAEDGFSVYFSARGDAFSYLRNLRDRFRVLGGGKEMLWKQKEDGSPDFWGTLKEPGLLKEFILHILEEKARLEAISPDVVISDSRLQTVIASEYLGLPTVSILNQPKLLLHPIIIKGPIFNKRRFSIAEKIESVVNSTLTRFWALSQASLIADFPPPFSISRYQTSNLPKALVDRLVFTGPLLNPECSGDEGDFILIMISGPEYERKPIIGDLLELLREVPEDLKGFKFIMSLGEPGELNSWNIGTNVKVYNWLPNKWEFLSKAKVVVSRAGHTIISESLLCGKPLLLIPVPGQTEKVENARSVEDLGFGYRIEQNSLKIDFFERLRALLSNEEIFKRVKEFREKFSDWDFLGRAAGVVESVIY